MEGKVKEKVKVKEKEKAKVNAKETGMRNRRKASR